MPLTQDRTGVAAAEDGVRAAVIDCVADVLAVEPDELQPDSVLLELGAQSLDFLAIAYRLGRLFDVRVPRVYAVPGAHTTETLVQAVLQEMAATRCSTTREEPRDDR
jgi:acyl carrier protein